MRDLRQQRQKRSEENLSMPMMRPSNLSHLLVTLV
jgi:hypothetical protein